MERQNGEDGAGGGVMIEVAIPVIVVTVAALGYGALLARFLRIGVNLGDLGILGLLGLALVGCVLHLAVPLSLPVHCLLVGVGVALAVMHRDRLAGHHSGSEWAGAAVALIFAASFQQTSPLNYDYGLYYLQTMRWLREHSIVPGLGNLHSRLAYNSIVFPLTAVADQAARDWIPNMLAQAFVIASLLARLQRMAAHCGFTPAVWLSILTIAGLPLQIHGEFGKLFGSTNADALLACLVVYWCCLAAGLSNGDRDADSALLIVSAAFAITVKLSGAPLAAATAVLLIAGRIRADQPAVLRRASALASALVGTWILRSIVLSGCVVYPVTATCIPFVPWNMAEQSASDTAWIASWARKQNALPEEVLRDMSWIWAWLERGNKYYSHRLVAALLAPSILAGLFSRRRMRGSLTPDFLAAAAAAFGGLVFWFVTAPEFRFGAGFLLGCTLVMLSALLGAATSSIRLASPTRLYGLLAIGLLMAALWQAPKRTHGHYVYLPPPLAKVKGVAGPGERAVYVTVDSDQCWDHPLPCTHHFAGLDAFQRVRWPAAIR